jgi:hypothetical protein
MRITRYDTVPGADRCMRCRPTGAARRYCMTEILQPAPVGDRVGDPTLTFTRPPESRYAESVFVGQMSTAITHACTLSRCKEGMVRETGQGGHWFMRPSCFPLGAEQLRPSTMLSQRICELRECPEWEVNFCNRYVPAPNDFRKCYFCEIYNIASMEPRMANEAMIIEFGNQTEELLQFILRTYATKNSQDRSGPKTSGSFGSGIRAYYYSGLNWYIVACCCMRNDQRFLETNRQRVSGELVIKAFMISDVAGK